VVKAKVRPNTLVKKIMAFLPFFLIISSPKRSRAKRRATITEKGWLRTIRERIKMRGRR